MSDLKEDLKTAQGFLKSGNNEKAIEVLKSYTEDEPPNFRALCFIALAYMNTSDYDESYKMYKKAVEIDEKQLIVWKGLFKLFEGKSCTKPDQFALRVCEFMQKNGEDEKRQAAATQARRRIMFEMEMWNEILERFQELQFNSDFEILKKIVIRFDSRCENEVQEKLLAETLRAFKDAKMLQEDASLMLAYCKYFKEEGYVNSLISFHKQMIDDDWVQKKLLDIACQHYFETKRFPESVQHVKCASAETMNVLTALRENDIPVAIDALDEIDDISSYPDCLLFVDLLAEKENWEAVEKLSRSIMQYYKSSTCNGWICRALLEMEPESTEKLQALGPLPLPAFAVEEMKVALLSNNEERITKLLTEYKDKSNVGIMLRVIKALFSADPISPDLVKLADQLSIEKCQELILTAEIRIRAGLDANTLLVKAAKLNPRCSKAFFLLGNCVAAKNATKAKSLIERAILIRPANEEYIKALHDVLVKKGFPPEQRLKLLTPVISKRKNRRKPFWLSDALSRIYMDMNNLTEAIDELQQMVRVHKDNKAVWARLADAYTRKGHLRAAVSSYTELAEMDGGHEFVISITRVLLQLREFSDAFDKITEFRQRIEDEKLELCEESTIVMNLTEAEIRLNLHDTTCGEQKLHHLKKAFEYLTICYGNGNCSFRTVYKLFGDAFLVVSKYSERIIPYFNIDQKWQATNPLECVSASVSFYMAVLKVDIQNALAWYDVAVSLLSKFKIENDQSILPKVRKLLEHALSITTVDTLLSSLWTLLAETKRLIGDPMRQQLHCICRALQLNKSNDAAWLTLSVICLEAGMINEASRLLEQSIKYNPHNADAWCAWAQAAHLQGETHEALAMFRQALFVRPISSAIVGYSTYLCDKLKKTHHRFESATAALDFESIIDLKYLSSANEDVLYHLGILADLFGWYPESLECFQLSKSPKITDEIQHAMVKADVLYNKIKLDPSSFNQTNSRICRMFGLSAADCFTFLVSEMDVYRDLYRFIESKDASAFRKLYMVYVKAISVPLFVAGLILKKMDLPSEFIRTMHDALPRHELIDYFPTALPDGMDDGLRHLEQDGEEPFRYRHRSAYRLLDELKLLRAQLEDEKVKKEEIKKEEVAENMENMVITERVRTNMEEKDDMFPEMTIRICHQEDIQS